MGACTSQRAPAHQAPCGPATRSRGLTIAATTRVSLGTDGSFAKTELRARLVVHLSPSVKRPRRPGTRSNPKLVTVMLKASAQVIGQAACLLTGCGSQDGSPL